MVILHLGLWIISSGGCSTLNQITMGNGTSANSTTGYPAIYGNWYRNTRHQILYKASELLTFWCILPGKISGVAFNIRQLMEPPVTQTLQLK